MGVLMDMASFDHPPIQTLVIVGPSIELPHSNLFELNVSHIELTYFVSSFNELGYIAYTDMCSRLDPLV